MSEKMSPSAVALLLNDYLSRMTDVIFKYEGTLDKYIGDAIMAVFGAPLDMPDHAAARDPHRARDAGAARRSGTPSARRARSLRIRIGINSGKARGRRDRQHQQEGVHGARRHREHREPARELGGQAGHGRDRRATRSRLVEGLFECRPLGSFSLKGKEREVLVYEVIGAVPKRPPSPPPAGEA